MRNFGPSLIKPARWPLQPHLTAAPELWRGCEIFHALWEGLGDPFAAFGPNGVMASTPPTWFIGGEGYALSFDEKDDYYTIADSAALTITDEFTLAFRMRIPDNDGLAFQYWYSWGGYSAIPSINIYTFEGGGELKILCEGDLGTQDVRTTHAIAPFSDWKTIVLAKQGKGSATEFWVDGNKVPVTININGDLGVVKRADALNIGRRSDGDAQRYYGGEIGWWAKWDRHISAHAIKHLSRDPFAMLRPGSQAIPLLFGGAGATDTTPPQFQFAEVPASGDSVTVRFDDSLAGSTSAADWTVRDETNAEDETINSASISGTDVILSLGSTIYSGETVTLDYGGTTLEDTAGNQVASFSGEAVTNNSTQTASTTTTIGISSTSETAFSVTPKKTQETGQTAESAAGLPLTARRTHNLEQTTAANTAFTVTIARTKSAGQASLTPSALSVTPNRTRTISLTSSVNTAQVIDHSRTYTVGLSTTADTAFAISSGTTKNIVLGQATTASQAFNIKQQRSLRLGLAPTTDSAFAISLARAYLIGLTTESDTAFGFLGTITLNPRDGGQRVTLSVGSRTVTLAQPGSRTIALTAESRSVQLPVP